MSDYDPEIFSEPKGQLGKLNQKKQAYDASIFNAGADTGAPKKYNIGIAGLPEAASQVIGNFSPLSQAAIGTYTAVDNPALRLKQLAVGLTPEEESRAQVNRAVLGASPYAMGGNVAGQLPLGMGAVGRFGLSLPGAAAVGAGQGFAGNPVLQGESGVGNAARGALTAVPANIAGRFVTGSPLVQPSAQTSDLLRQGIVPTIGQNAASKPGILPRIIAKKEEEATSIPFVGDFIKASRQRATDEFNRAAMNRGMPPGQSVMDIGTEGLQQAKDALGSAYDKVYQGVQVMPDAGLKQGINAAKISTNLPLSSSAQKQFDQIMNRNLWERLPKNAPVEAGTVKMEIESALGKVSRDLKASGSPGDRALGEAVQNARDEVRNWLNRNVGAKSSDLPALNKARADRAAVDSAVERAKAQGGVFTPYQLQSASRPGTSMRELADTGQAVLASKVPNSYSADRALNAGLLMAGAPAGAALYLGAPYLSALGLAPLAYSRAGMRHMLGDLTPALLQQQAPILSQGLRAYEMQQ